MASVSEWFDETLSEKPEEFQKLNPNTYMQRTNAKKITITNPNTKEDEVYWTCRSRKIPTSLYNEYMSNKAAPTNDALRAMITDLQEKQKTNDENTLIVMSALADLYETVALLTPTE